MAKKRKTLPKDFEERLKTAGVDQLKAVYDKCELTAYTGYNKVTALSLQGVPDELVRWLVESGLDVDTQDNFHNTPLQYQITHWGSVETIKLLIELGADVNNADGPSRLSTLHKAARSKRAEVIQLLIDNGADVNALNFSKQTPLDYCLGFCPPAEISRTLPCAEVFLKAGSPVTDKTKGLVTKIGEQFEFYRDGFNKDYLDETVDALNKLYKLFDVPPVPQRRRHDGSSPITVSEDVWYKQHDQLWQFLVPGSGHAATVQGEVIRITGRVANEIMDNGGINWDADYRKMLDALKAHLASGNSLPNGEYEEAERIIRKIYGGTADNEPERLMEISVHWVIANPNPVKLEEPNYRR